MASRPARATRDRPSSATHSGKLLLRMPPALHARLAEEAEREHVSLNQLITKRLEESLRKTGTGAAEGAPEAVPGDDADRRRRLTTVALVVNLAVVLVAGAAAILLLVVALLDLS